MKMLITLEEFNKAKWGEMTKIPCECRECTAIFYAKKSLVKRALKGTKKVDFCSKKCSANYLRGTVTKLYCDCCQQKFERKGSSITQQIRRGNKHSFCSTKCAVDYRNSVRKVIFCSDCQCEIPKGSKMCKSCHIAKRIAKRDFKRKEYRNRWLNGQEKGWQGKTFKTHTEIRRYLFEKYQNKCCKCQWGVEHPITKRVPLEVNHIDGNPANCKESNLELICPNCHSLTPNFRNLNKNSPRQRK
jgi:hypothetical protein